MTRSHRRSAWLIVAPLACACFLACACDEERGFLMAEESIGEGTSYRFLGGSCSAMKDGSRGRLGGGPAASGSKVGYTVDYEMLDSQVRIVVTVNATSVERSFDTEWLHGGGSAETIELPLDEARSYKIRFYGGPECIIASAPSDADAGRD